MVQARMLVRCCHQWLLQRPSRRQGQHSVRVSRAGRAGALLLSAFSSSGQGVAKGRETSGTQRQHFVATVWQGMVGVQRAVSGARVRLSQSRGRDRPFRASFSFSVCVVAGKIRIKFESEGILRGLNL